MKIKRTEAGTKATTKGNKKAWSDPKKRRLRILRMRRGCKKRNNNPEYIHNLTLANRKHSKTKEHSENSRRSAIESWKNPKTRRIRIRKIKAAFATTESREKRSASTSKSWASFSDKKKQAIAEKVWKAGRRKMNGLETKAKQLFKGSYLRYVGNNKVWIAGHCPDFIIKCRKRIVEVFGDYWHTTEKALASDKKKLADYKNAGYTTLVVWEHDVYDLPSTIRRRVLRFVANS